MPQEQYYFGKKNGHRNTQKSILSGRFGDSYERAGDRCCIRESSHIMLLRYSSCWILQSLFSEESFSASASFEKTGIRSCTSPLVNSTLFFRPLACFLLQQLKLLLVSLLFVVQFCKKINLVVLPLQTLMTVSITLVKTVALVWMASTTSRVTARRGILGVTARQVYRFEAKLYSF